MDAPVNCTSYSNVIGTGTNSGTVHWPNHILFWKNIYIHCHLRLHSHACTYVLPNLMQPKRPPPAAMEIHALMAMIFQGLHQNVWTYIQQDCQVSVQDAVYTNAKICAIYGMSMSNLSTSLRYMGGEPIFMYNGCRFIRNIVVICGRGIRRSMGQVDAHGTRPRYSRRHGGGILRGYPRSCQHQWGEYLSLT